MFSFSALTFTVFLWKEIVKKLHFNYCWNLLQVSIHQHSTSSLYTCRSQKCKKTVKLSVFFAHLGSAEAQMMVCFCHYCEKQNWGIIGKSLMWMIKIQYVYFSLIEGYRNEKGKKWWRNSSGEIIYYLRYHLLIKLLLLSCWWCW